MSEVRAVEGEEAPGGFIEPDDGFAEGRFATAGFSNETEGFAWLKGQSDIIDGLDAAGGALEDAGFDGEVEAEVFGGETRGGGRRRRKCWNVER
jgi:hypothetical protein